MKRRVAVAAVASVLALFVLTGQAAAQQGPSISADPPAVPGEGTYTFTITGSGWTAGTLIFIVPCTVSGEQLTTAHSTDAIIAAMSGATADSCVLSPLGSATAGDDGTFTVEVTHDVPANFAFGAGDATGAESSAVPILFIAADMGDDMAPEGGADTGFGGMADPDGDSVAVPLAASLAAVILLSGTALILRRNN
jgi:hypothetical protein